MDKQTEYEKQIRGAVAGSPVAWGVGQANAAPARAKASCDQESLVKQRIKTAMRMIVAISQERGVAAEQGMLERGVDGIIEGCAEEIIKTLGMEPEYTNIRRR